MRDLLDRLIVALPRFDASVRVGVFGEDNVAEAQHLAWAEFGTTRGEPMRPTLSGVWDGALPATLSGVARGAKALIDGKVPSGEFVLDRLGWALAEAERQALDMDIPPPLAASTLAGRRRRGNQSTATLVDSGKMRDAVSHEAKTGGSGWPQ